MVANSPMVKPIRKKIDFKMNLLPYWKPSTFIEKEIFDLIDENTGLILAEAGDELNEELVETLREAGVFQIPTLDVDHVTVGAYIRNTLKGDKNSTRDQALIDIYRVMRPGEPPTVEAAQNLFNSMFFDPERYDLSDVGRVKINSKLNFSEEQIGKLLNHASRSVTDTYIHRSLENVRGKYQIVTDYLDRLVGSDDNPGARFTNLMRSCFYGKAEPSGYIPEPEEKLRWAHEEAAYWEGA